MLGTCVHHNNGWFLYLRVYTIYLHIKLHPPQQHKKEVTWPGIQGNTGWQLTGRLEVRNLKICATYLLNRNVKSFVSRLAVSKVMLGNRHGMTFTVGRDQCCLVLLLLLADAKLTDSFIFIPARTAPRTSADLKNRIGRCFFHKLVLRSAQSSPESPARGGGG